MTNPLFVQIDARVNGDLRCSMNAIFKRKNIKRSKRDKRTIVKSKASTLLTPNWTNQHGLNVCMDYHGAAARSIHCVFAKAHRAVVLAFLKTIYGLSLQPMLIDTEILESQRSDLKWMLGCVQIIRSRSIWIKFWTSTTGFGVWGVKEKCLESASGELNPDGGLGVEAELVTGEPGEEVGFPDAGVADQHRLEQVFVLLFHPLRHPPAPCAWRRRRRGTRRAKSKLSKIKPAKFEHLKVRSWVS